MEDKLLEIIRKLNNEIIENESEVPLNLDGYLATGDIKWLIDEVEKRGKWLNHWITKANKQQQKLYEIQELVEYKEYGEDEIIEMIERIITN